MVDGHEVPEGAGPREAIEQQFLSAYQELRRLARSMFAAERAGHTLQATAILNEAFLRLRSAGDTTAADPVRFRQAAAVAMRRILIDHARGKHRVKRGGGKLPQSLDSVELAAAGDFDQVLAIDEAIEQLAVDTPDLAELVRLRVYAGLDVAGMAETLGRSERSVYRDWTFARARLVQILARRD